MPRRAALAALEELEAEGCCGAGATGPRWPRALSDVFTLWALAPRAAASDSDMREAASLRQQRRTSSAVQFIHKTRPTCCPGRPQEAGFVQGHGEPPRAAPASGTPRAAVYYLALWGWSPRARPSPLSLSHRPGPLGLQPLSAVSGALLGIALHPASPASVSLGFQSSLPARPRFSAPSLPSFSSGAEEPCLLASAPSLL